MRLLIWLILGSFTALAFNNCSGFKSIQGTNRAVVMGTHLLSGDPDSPGGGHPPTQPEPPQRKPPPKTDPIPIATVCSQDDTGKVGGNVLGSSTLIAQVLNSGGQVVCTITDPSLRENLINKRIVDAALISQKCPDLPEGKYEIDLKAGSSGNLFVDASAANFAKVQAVYPLAPAVLNMVLGANPSKLQKAAFTALYIFYFGISAPFYTSASQNSGAGLSLQSNSDSVGAVLYDTNPGYATSSDAKCDLAASPLIVQIQKGQSIPSPIELSAPLSGVEFDILGANSFPKPYAKKLISWFAPTKAAGNYFIVLPDKNGFVRGIDQMFGDNTRGPDGAFAKTGYEALAKWDIDQDGAITKKDDVFSDLRLWSDVNGNGIAESSELHTLSELDVVSIDLDYDRDYAEHDAYGNEIRYKSITTTGDGVEHVTYDIWFRTLPAYARK